MKDRTEIQNNIENLVIRIRRLYITRDYYYTATRLLFLKYAVDNFIGADDVGTMQMYSRAQKMFSRRDVENGFETVTSVIQHIDRFYSLNGVIDNPDVLDHYAMELFGIGKILQKTGNGKESFADLMDTLGRLDLEENQESGNNSIGKAIASVLYDLIEQNERYVNSKKSRAITNESIAKLAGGLLQVTPDDTFCDFTSGLGRSTVVITENGVSSIQNIEIDPETASLAAMFYIMCGLQNFKIDVLNAFNDSAPLEAYSKVFVDPPVVIERTNGDKDSTSYAPALVMEQLRRRSRIVGVMVVSSSFLFKSTQSAAAIRYQYSELGFIKAVIALPPLTSFGTNLIVISNSPGNETVFIDASKCFNKKELSDGYRLSDELIEKIVSAYRNKSVIEGFSNVVYGHNSNDYDTNLVPAHYVKPQKAEDSMTLAEIDAKLAELYDQLKRL